MKKTLLLCMAVSGIYAKKTVDYNNAPLSKAKLVLTTQTLPMLPAVSYSQLAGYLYQGFRLPNAALGGTASTTESIIPNGVTDLGYALAVQQDGKIVLTGTSYTGFQMRISIARFLTNGQLDTSFGGTNGSPAGTAYIPFNIQGTGTTDEAFAIAIQPDGKIVVAGLTKNGANASFFALARFLPNGYLDTSFGGHNNGTTFLPVQITGGNEDVIESIALQENGAIVAVGYSKDGTNHYFMAAARYTSAGLLDDSFNGAGYTYIPFSIVGGGTDDVAYHVKIRPNGTLVLGGYTSSFGSAATYFAAAQLLSNGQLDTAFGQINTARAGTTYIPFSICGSGSSDGAYKLNLQTDGKIILSGYTSVAGFAGSYFAVARLLENGQLDTTFGQTQTARAGTAYTVQHITPCVNETAYGNYIQPDGSIILGGMGTNFAGISFIAVARFFSNGQIDTSFAGNLSLLPGSTYIQHFTGGTDEGSYSMGLQSDGKITLGGYSKTNLGFGKFSVVTLTNNYTLATYQDEYPNQGGFY